MRSSEYEVMFRMEERHWWYQALHRWIFWALSIYLPDWKDRDILDAGCGTGAVLQRLSNREKHVGIDLASEAIDFCRQRGLENVQRADLMSLPFADEMFDAVVCSSVLYHRWVSNVPQALRELHRVLRPGGVIILNLPACECLRSPHDEAVFTAQRFSKKQVSSLLRSNGFEVRKLTCWTTFLFPLALAARTLGLSSEGRDFDTSRASELRNRIFTSLMAFEFAVLQRISMPVGVSLFCAARKTTNYAEFSSR